jgi:predicted acyltransferase
MPIKIGTCAKVGSSTFILSLIASEWVAKTSQDQFPPSFLDNCGANIAFTFSKFNANMPYFSSYPLLTAVTVYFLGNMHDKL